MTGVIKFANNATSNLAAAILSTDTTCTLAPGTGALFPALTAGEYFVVTLTDALTRTLKEIVQVTAIVGDEFTVMARGQEGTTPQPWNAGDVVSLQLTAASLIASLGNVQTQIPAGTNVVLGAPAVAGGTPPLLTLAPSLTITGGALAGNIGPNTGQLADGGVVAGFSTSITAANTTAGLALTAANAAQPKIAAASGSLLGGPVTLGGTLAAIALGAGLALSGGSLAVAFGTGANQAVAGSSIGAANGVAGLDANASVSAQTVIATGAAAGTALGLGDHYANIALFGGNLMVSPLATNIGYATGGTGQTGTGAVNIPWQSKQGYVGLTPQGSSIVSSGPETTLCFGIGAGGLGTRTSGFGPKNIYIGYGAGNVNTQSGVTAIGFGVLNVSTGAGQDTAVGSSAGANQTSGGFNSYFGSNCGSQNSTGIQSCFMGHGTAGGLDYVNGQVGNLSLVTALGTYALQGAMGGGNIVAVGTSCLPYLNCYLISPAYGGIGYGSNTTALGYSIGCNTVSATAGNPTPGVGTAVNSTFVGAGILNNSGSYATYSGNIQLTSQLSNIPSAVIVGAFSFINGTTGYHTIVGTSACSAATAATHLNVFGYNGLNNATTATDIVAMGHDVAQYFVDGSQSVFIGNLSSYCFASSTNNVVIGHAAASNIGAVIKGSIAGTTLTVAAVQNTAFGSNPIKAGPLYIEGAIVANILAFGTAGTTGNGFGGTYALDTSLAYPTGTIMACADYSNLICIGANTYPTASNQIYIGNGNITSIVMGGSSPLVNIALPYVGVGNLALNLAVSGITQTVAIGSYAAQYASTSSYSTYLGASSGGNFLVGAYNVAVGCQAASNSCSFKGTINGTALTFGSFINGNNPVALGPLFINGTKVANIITNNGGGSYTLDTNLGTTYATSTPMALADFNHTITIGAYTNPSASNQIVLGSGTFTSCYIGGTAPGGLAAITATYTAVGTGSMAAITTGIYNETYGINSMASLTTGAQNSAFGRGALNALVSVNDCSGFGFHALTAATGVGNSAFGSTCGQSLTTGTYNAFFGAYSGNQFIAGSNNIAIGYSASNGSGDYSNTIIIGKSISASASNQIVIGSSSYTVNIAGAFSMATGATGAATFAGTVAASSYVGQTAGVAVVAGSIGEQISNSVNSTSGANLVTATATNTTSITLSAGVWNVSGTVCFALTSATCTSLQCAISTASATLPAVANAGGGAWNTVNVTFGSGGTNRLPTGTTRILITPAMVSGATNIVYLVCQASFSAGTVYNYGSIYASRVA